MSEPERRPLTLIGAPTSAGAYAPGQEDAEDGSTTKTFAERLAFAIAGNK